MGDPSLRLKSGSGRDDAYVTVCPGRDDARSMDSSWQATIPPAYFNPLTT